ncbi:hypothetical protein SDC9_99155 [bioreactor metagenome]|uniref:Uncharacterized protein n=1 Tax=bioreactor metagenome TaxID=1076179 RepID=A0A645AHI1_9ZZZZ
MGGRVLVKKPRQNGPQGRHLRIHPAQALDHPPLPVQEDQVGVAAHGLQHQRPPSRLAEIVRDVQLQLHQTLQPRLSQRRHPRTHQMLSQKHTEHGRLRGIVPKLAGQMDAGIAGSGVQQQAQSAPQQQNDLISGGLLHLVDAHTQKLRAQLFRHRL